MRRRAASLADHRSELLDVYRPRQQGITQRRLRRVALEVLHRAPRSHGSVLSAYSKGLPKCPAGADAIGDANAQS